MEQSPSHGQSLFHPRGVLSERFVNLLRKFKPIHYESNAICENFSVHLVEAAEKLEILPAGEPPVKTALIGRDIAKHALDGGIA